MENDYVRTKDTSIIGQNSSVIKKKYFNQLLEQLSGPNLNNYGSPRKTAHGFHFTDFLFSKKRSRVNCFMLNRKLFPVYSLAYNFYRTYPKVALMIMNKSGFLISFRLCACVCSMYWQFCKKSCHEKTFLKNTRLLFASL